MSDSIHFTFLIPHLNIGDFIEKRNIIDIDIGNDVVRVFARSKSDFK